MGAALTTAPRHSNEPPRSTVANANAARRRAAAIRQRAALGDRIPKHVENCYHRGGRAWWLYVWKKDNAAAVTRIPYQCESWRCDVCRKHDARVNYARFQEASADLDPSGWCFLTLTVPRAGFQGWQDCDQAYKALSQMSRNFHAALKRWMVKQGWYDEHERVSKKTGNVRIVKKARWSNQWIGVVEAHRSGWPHMHFALWSPELAEWLRENPTPENLLPDKLADDAERVGWGNRCTLEPARSRDKVASYLLKLSGEVDSMVGEIAKMTQLPTVAPVRFRRVRAGKNFLPPRRKNPDYTGTLLRRRPCESGYDVAPIHRVKDCPVVAHLCAQEETRAMHAYWTKTPEQPVVRVTMPAHVVRSYHAGTDAAERDNRADGRPDCADASAGKVLPSHGAYQAAQRLTETTAREAQCESDARRRKDPQRLKPTTVSSAGTTLQPASMSQTVFSELVMPHDALPRSLRLARTLLRESTERLTARPEYLAGNGAAGDRRPPPPP